MSDDFLFADKKGFCQHFSSSFAVLMRAAEIYHQRFATTEGRIPATFDIICLTGWAPHESQQKPLRPGSAAARLADALNAAERPLPRGNG